jgi:predicted O-methyltransferase YrrM
VIQGSWLAEKLSPFVLVLREWRAIWTLPHSGPRVDALRRALRASATGRLSREERVRLRRIEALRSRLLQDSTELTVKDYGAGSGDETLEESDMARGRTKTLTVGEACGFSKPRPWARLLFHLVRELEPEVCVEMGTCVGISAAYQATALKLNGHGRLITMEGAGPLARVSRENLVGLGLDTVQVVTGRFQDALGDVLEEYAPVDFVFVDGHHDEHATLRYFEQALPHLEPGAVLVFDDIAWSAGMARAWSSVADHPDVNLAVSLGAMGLCVVGGA